ncbi:unnamed protein product [Mytilus coruscus]|uniref:C2H2-type domain-containing protein n=1 Tax=Mytilus coruscus TaxID=42192 RepID=A0A6J8AW42_MYTCO|nr:unnamed protein product [Mytilus coruscus]
MVFLQCSLCRYQGKKKHAVVHYLKRHLPEKEVPYFCVLCKFRAVNKSKWEKHLHSFSKHINAINSCLTKLSDSAYCKESNKKFELDISPNGQLIPIENINVCVQTVQQSTNISLLNNICCENNDEPVPEYSGEIMNVPMTEEDQNMLVQKKKYFN